MRILRAVCVALFAFSSLTVSANVDWTYLEHPDFVNKSPGVDGLWGTFDDLFIGTGAGANPLGSATVWQSTAALGNISFLSGVNTTSGPIPVGAGTLEHTSSVGTFELLGAGFLGATAPIDPSETSTWTILSDQSVLLESFFLGDLRLAGDGYIFKPGQTANSLLGATALADHIDYMLSRVASPYDAVIYFDLTFTDFAGVPNGFGSVDGIFIASPVPLPAGVWMLLSALGVLGGRAGIRRSKLS